MSRKTQGASLPSRNARVGEAKAPSDEAKGIVDEIKGAVGERMVAFNPSVPQLERRVINVAFGEPPGYSGPLKFSMRVNQPHIKTFRRIFAGLHNAHVRKNDGKHVDSWADVILYIMEEIARSQPPDPIDAIPATPELIEPSLVTEPEAQQAMQDVV